MENFEPKKLALIRILQIFKKHSDSDHPLTQDDIAGYLERDYGIAIERKAVGRNISLLREAGIEIESKRSGSYLEERDFEDSELRMLIDGILCSKYIRVDKMLYREINSNDRGFTASELKKCFESWYDNKLRTSVFPQYKEAVTAKAEIKKLQPRGNAIDTLNKMIGLSQAKAVISKALNFYKVQKLYKSSGISMERPAMHMIFTGNPGTAKTTVARLFAQIMKDNGLLTKGDLYEVGRADLVGKYVGWTAQIVKEKFKAAKGSVLFIDEAYSLVCMTNGLV